MSSAQKHAGPGTPSGEPAVPEPSYAERARTLAYLGRIGSLSTLSRKQPGFPFGSVMPYSIDERGRPIFLISTMAMHTQNLQADARASLLVTQLEAGGDPLGASRVTLVGTAALVPDAEVSEVRNAYLDRYENSRHWVDFEDFAFWRMELTDVYYIGGFGVMGWVTAEEFGSAQPDPLADSAARIIEHMNADHGDAMILMAREFRGIEAQEAKMTGIDRLGFHMRLKTAEGMRGARIAFPRDVGNAQQTREVLVEMTGRAREKGHA